jgi:hypothetical protein
MQNTALEGKYFLFFVESGDNICTESWSSVYRVLNNELTFIYSPSDHTEYQSLGDIEDNFEETTLKYLLKHQVKEVYSSSGLNLKQFKKLLCDDYEELEREDEEELEKQYSSYAVKNTPTYDSFHDELRNNKISFKRINLLSLEELLTNKKMIRGEVILDVNSNEATISTHGGRKYILTVENVREI